MPDVWLAEATSFTDPGRRHPDNEDWYGSLEPTDPDAIERDGRLYVIADGASGYGTGHEASQLAGSAILQAYQAAPQDSAPVRLESAMVAGNRSVCDRRAMLAGGGQARPFLATAICALIRDGSLWVANVGACRAYLFRTGELTQLTRDHTWMNEQVDKGLMTTEEARGFPWSETVTRALGEAEQVSVDVIEHPLAPGDRVLLCSDGLWRMVDGEAIRETLGSEAVESAARSLVDLANEHGGRDNVTLTLVEVQAKVAGDQQPGRPIVEPTPASAKAEAPPSAAAPVAVAPGADHLARLREIGHHISASLDLNATLNTVMDSVVEATHGQYGQLLLWNDAAGQLQMSMGRGDHPTDVMQPGFSHKIARDVFESGEPLLLGDAQSTQDYDPSASVILHNLRSVMCAPLQVKDRRTGVVYVENRLGSNVFTRNDLDLLCAVADEAAIALENARLYEELRAQMQELAFTRTNHENVLRSISSGIISLDNQGRVLVVNPSAERVLDISASEAAGRQLDDLLPRPVRRALNALAVQIKAGDEAPEAVQLDAELPGRGKVTLSVRGFPLRDAGKQSSGTLLVIDDMTQSRLLSEAWLLAATERERMMATFGRFLPASVVEQLSSSPEAIRLGGARRPVTVLFADIRGFTGFAEHHSPEEVMRMLNSYLTHAIDEVLEAGGMIDKILGDGLMALFNAPLDQDDHVMAAARAAISMQRRLRELRAPDGEPIQIGVGVSTGEALVGNIGNTDIMNYTAIGDVVNVAARLQGDARAGEILLSGPAYQTIASRVEAEKLGPVYVKGRAEPVAVYKLLQIPN